MMASRRIASVAGVAFSGGMLLLPAAAAALALSTDGRLHARLGQPLAVDLPLSLDPGEGAKLAVSVVPAPGLPATEREVASGVHASYDAAVGLLRLETLARVNVPALQLRVHAQVGQVAVDREVSILFDLPSSSAPSAPLTPLVEPAPPARVEIEVQHEPEGAVRIFGDASVREAQPQPANSASEHAPAPRPGKPHAVHQPSQLPVAQGEHPDDGDSATWSPNRWQVGLGLLVLAILGLRKLRLRLRLRARLRLQRARGRPARLSTAGAEGRIGVLAAPVAAPETAETAHLRALLARQPHRADLRLRLVQRLYEERRSSAFAEAALPLRPALAPEAWARVCAMGHALLPCEPLFSPPEAPLPMIRISEPD